MFISTLINSLGGFPGLEAEAAAAPTAILQQLIRGDLGDLGETVLLWEDVSDGYAPPVVEIIATGTGFVAFYRTEEGYDKTLKRGTLSEVLEYLRGRFPGRGGFSEEAAEEAADSILIDYLRGL